MRKGTNWVGENGDGGAKYLPNRPLQPQSTFVGLLAFHQVSFREFRTYDGGSCTGVEAAGFSTTLKNDFMLDGARIPLGT